MKRTLALLFCLLVGTLPAVHAQPKRAIRAAASTAAKQSKQASTRAVQAAGQVQKALQKAARKQHLSPEKRQSLINDLFAANPAALPTALVSLQAYQHQYGPWDFAARFFTLYYERHFGRPTPVINAFFEKVNELNSPALQRKVALRMQELILNKNLYLAHLGEMENPPFVRTIYLADIKHLTAKSFRPKDLAYNCEINVEPGGFIALGEGQEISTLLIEGTPWHISGFAAGLDYLPDLYRFLMTELSPDPYFNVLWDKSAQSLLLSSPDNSLQLRVARHEYNTPHRLHLHLYRLVPAVFKDIHGRSVREQTLLNISFPIENETLNPRVPLKDWFITFPVKQFLKDPNVHVSQGKVF